SSDLPGQRISQLVSELDRIRLPSNRPFPAVLHGIQSVGIVVLVVIGLAQHTDAYLDESPASLGLIETQRLAVDHKLFRRTGNSRAGTGNDVRAFIDEVVDTRI